MKLDILVTHHKESWDVCHNLFDSLAIQRGINFENVRVIVANDGQELVIGNQIYESYPYEVKTVIGEKKGVSATRNLALDNSDADYVMFCDIDDMFLNNYGLHMVFSAMNEGFDTMHSCFIEEQPDGDEWRILRHDKDITFIHGKVHNRKFLVDNNLRFNDELTIHEDGFFNMMVHTVAENIKYVSTPFYLWVYNKESTVRKDKENYLYKTYENLMACRMAIAKELEERGYIDEFMDSVVHTICNSYYDFCKPSAIKNKDSVLIKNAEKEFKKYFDLYGDTYYECNARRIADTMMVARANAFQNGLLAEDKTLVDWLTHIRNIKA